MVTEFGIVTLKSNEQARLVHITAPEPSWTDRILPFLAHKGEPWMWPMKLALDEGLPGVRMNFFVAMLDDQLAGNITTTEANGIGMLQHVYTNPDHRRKGICQLLMQAVTDDFGARGGRAMYLGTGYDTPPFWIYHSFGFRSILETGAMRWLPEEGFEGEYFGPGETTVREARWEDWPALDALYLTERGWYLRGFACGHYGHSSYEGLYPALMKAADEGRVQQMKVLVKDDGAVVGHAMIGVQPAWRGEPYVLDFFVHPTFARKAYVLLQSLELPTDRKVQCYCDAEAKPKMAALQAAEFRREAVLKRQIQRGDEWLDVVIFARNV